MYRLFDFGHMLNQRVRMDAYEAALRQAVRPGATVLDLGTGTGIFALLACRFGARHVYAVEPLEVVQVAREIAAANGLADRITFLQARSTEVTLPERVDVIVADLRGSLPLYQDSLAALDDARTRFLAPGGVLIPERDDLWATCVEAPAQHSHLCSPWSDNRWGLDMAPARRLEANTCWTAKLQPGQFLAEPARLGVLDYAAASPAPFRGEVALAVAVPGTGHGLGVWFDAVLLGDIGFSNAPGQPPIPVYQQTFFPWPEPVELQPGEVVAAAFRQDPAQGAHLWTWHTRVLDAGGQLRQEFRQSEFLKEPLAPATLRRQAAAHVPVLGLEGRIDRLVLARMAEAVPLGAIAGELAAAHPDRFADAKAALARVAELSLRYGQ